MLDGVKVTAVCTQVKLLHTKVGKAFAYRAGFVETGSTANKKIPQKTLEDVAEISLQWRKGCSQTKKNRAELEVDGKECRRRKLSVNLWGWGTVCEYVLQ